MEERVTIINDVPASTAARSAIDVVLRRALQPYRGPWLVRLRAVEVWQSDDGWSVDVSRPGHVWTLRVSGPQQEPEALVCQVVDAVQRQRFGTSEG